MFWSKLFDANDISRYVNVTMCSRVEAASADGITWYVTAMLGTVPLRLEGDFTSKADASTAARLLCIAANGGLDVSALTV